MAVIQKRADELKPGDVWRIVNARYVVLSALPNDTREKVELVTCEMYETSEAGMRDRRLHPASTLFEVESPDLTSAQQHAEELAEAARLVVSAYDRGALTSQRSEGTISVEFARQTFDKIKPLEPPTLAEMAVALSSLAQLVPVSDRDHPLMREAAALSERVRRA